MRKRIYISLIVVVVLAIFFFRISPFLGSVISYNKNNQVAKEQTVQAENVPTAVLDLPPLDAAAYDAKLIEIANNPPPKGPTIKKVKDPKTGKITEVTVPPKPTPPNLWPVKTVYPNPGALLPFNRIIAYYGNLYSKNMGVLGQYPEAEMLQRLEAEVKKWEEADPSTPVIPALHYIAVVAQGNAGDSGKYRFRMPDSEIDKVITMAAKINAIVFLDIQVGFSNVETEVPLLEKYLKLPQVHLAIDPEFSMKTGIRPGKVVGTVDAKDVNFAADYLANLVRENKLTPKILMVHRYTQRMVTNYQNIKTLPEVQVVMNMDGWGDPAHKLSTYLYYIHKEPVQFTGFKLFYKNDILTGVPMMTPKSLLKLNPQPSYIQYQ